MAPQTTLGTVGQRARACVLLYYIIMSNSQQILQVFQFDGSPVTFQNGDAVMVNATEMAKPFNKSANHWLRNSQTQEYLEALSKLRNRNFNELVEVTPGAPSTGGGTWMHEDVALEFARWLSPAFAIWCNDRIKELITKGATTLHRQDDTPELIMARALQVAQTTIERATQRVQMLEGTVTALEEENRTLAPLAQYTDDVLQSTSTYTFTQISKDLGFRSVHTFTKALEGGGYIYKQSHQWLPRSEYSTQGYFSTRTAKYVKADGTPGSSISTVVTEQGRQFFHNLKKAGVL